MRPITTWFPSSTSPSAPSAPSAPSVPSTPNIEPPRKRQIDDLRQEEADRREKAIGDLKKRLENKKTRLEGQDYRRYQAVLTFLNHLQICWKEKQHRQAISVSLSVAKCFKGGKYLAKRIRSWAKYWLSEREIPRGNMRRRVLGSMMKGLYWQLESILRKLNSQRVS